MFRQVTKQNVAQKPPLYTVYMRVYVNFLWLYVIILQSINVIGQI